MESVWHSVNVLSGRACRLNTSLRSYEAGKENSMNGTMNTQLGEIIIDTDVIAKYAGSAAIECFGVVGMAAINVKDGLAKLLRLDNLNQGVNVFVDENRITINLHIIVSYGVSISAVAENLISNVKYKVEEFSGLNVIKINVYVEGVRVID
jgi:uncharacterized alkaline shock family protein YloU